MLTERVGGGDAGHCALSSNTPEEAAVDIRYLSWTTPIHEEIERWNGMS